MTDQRCCGAGCRARGGTIGGSLNCPSLPQDRAHQAINRIRNILAAFLEDSLRRTMWTSNDHGVTRSFSPHINGGATRLFRTPQPPLPIEERQAPLFAT